MAPVTVTANTFKSDVLESDKPVLVDFWAEWCGPCKKIAPVLDEVATELDGKAVIAKVNVDEERALAGMFQIMSIPSLLLFKDGKKVEEIRGIRPKGEITALIEKHL
ncbi:MULTISPECIES: thioredoxin [Corynebacterium]|uniref:Thioredoxin n=1 Tax=Corynebacterium amycolatum TaxID=43765 RepID=A0AB38XWE1_CORAY|nr:MULTISPECIES: thioredoxin [Corynebacterium]AIN81997.1 thioredoxin [Corynebacterium sp. ATCC 6931]MBC6725885.1 thioredoxin [Corynebacterium amycolatum]MCT1718805.1 thioredoxin [Corynebacterium amycolatum]MDK8819703.1 thioredoxin [Corynebacterium amycolatum]MDY7340849.1 thioredoxin [Corynebacterium amycolatum]